MTLAGVVARVVSQWGMGESALLPSVLDRAFKEEL